MSIHVNMDCIVVKDHNDKDFDFKELRNNKGYLKFRVAARRDYDTTNTKLPAYDFIYVNHYTDKDTDVMSIIQNGRKLLIRGTLEISVTGNEDSGRTYYNISPYYRGGIRNLGIVEKDAIPKFPERRPAQQTSSQPEKQTVTQGANKSPDDPF